MTNEEIESYRKYVSSIVYKYAYNNDYEDLVQVGLMALLKAKENYKEEYNTKFSTFARLYIMGEALKYVRENRLLKIGKDTLKLGRDIRRMKEKLQQEFLSEPTNEEIALALGKSIEEVDDAIKASDYVKSLDYELSDDENKTMNLYDSIKYEEKGFDEEVIMLKDAIDSLPQEEQDLIKYRYYDDLSQSEVSKKLNINQVQVSRRETKIKNKIKNKLLS